MQQRHTYDMGLIGNCAYLGYIEKTTNVAWLCWPRFDSSFIFGNLLDQDKGGGFAIVPQKSTLSALQYYLENTNILCTHIVATDGEYRVIDFAPRYKFQGKYHKPLSLVRKIEVVSGIPTVKMICTPRGDYGETRATAQIYNDHCICYNGLLEPVYLEANIPIEYILEGQSFRLLENCFIALSWIEPLDQDIDHLFKLTRKYWWGWVASCALPDIYQHQVIRSCLALKLHQYENTGAIVAAGSTSLPEVPNSERNWDYRYFWVRDSYYTLEVFRLVGHFEELAQYANFIRNIVDESRDVIQPIYSILGMTKLTERVLPLKGYRNNSPVRIGNDAYRQQQYDVFGQIILSLMPLYLDRRIVPPKRSQDIEFVQYLLNCIDKFMGKPDAGIWELRNTEGVHLYTVLFHWAGACSALRIGRHFNHRGLINQAKHVVRKAQKYIEACYSDELSCYTGSTTKDKIDAATLQLISMNYLTSPDKINEQLKVIEKYLDPHNNGFLFRYAYRDDFGLPEVAFLICSFWYVSALARVGKIEKALTIFDNLLKSSNHLGLLSEDISQEDSSQYGNFVQTYSHVGLVVTAFDLDFAIRRYNYVPKL